MYRRGSEHSQGNLALFQASYLTHSLLVAAYFLLIAVPVAYAVLKHHIIDVNVALSRATVYTVLSIIIVGVFALVDLFFTQALDQKSAGLMADIALALVLGFSFNTMHRHVDAFVDRFLFRKRHLAEEYLRRLAESMVHARSEAQVRTMLTNEPIRALELSSGRMVPCGGSDEQMEMLGSYVETHGSMRLSDRQWNLDAALAVPVFSHGALSEIALYGVHANGTDLDAEEVRLLEHLASSAGAAFDRLEAEELREKNALLQQKEHVLTEVIDKLGGVPQRG